MITKRKNTILIFTIKYSKSNRITLLNFFYYEFQFNFLLLNELKLLLN